MNPRKTLLPMLLAGGVHLAAKEVPPPAVDTASGITESVAVECEFSGLHSGVAFFGMNYRLKGLDIYSSMRIFETYHFGKDTLGDYGLLTFSLGATGVLGIALLALSEYGHGPPWIGKMLFGAPYLLNPELRYSRWNPIRPYLGYTVNLVYDEVFKPAGTVRTGLIFDHFKSQVRIKGGYEITRLGRRIDRSIQVGLAVGIQDDY